MYALFRNRRALDVMIGGALFLCLALGYNLYQRGQTDLPGDALAAEIAELEARLDDDAGALYDYLDLAHLHRLRGDLPRSIAVLERALQLEGIVREQKYAVMVRLSERQLEAGRLPAAWGSAADASAMLPDRAPAYNRRGDVRHIEGRTEDAVFEYETASRVEPGHPESYAKRAAVFEEEGDREAAEEVLNEGIRNNPTSSVALKNKGVYLLKQGRVHEAVQVLEAAVRAKPETAENWLALGRAYEVRFGKERRGSDLTGALAAYERSVHLDERQARVWERVGDLRRATNAPAAAVELAYRMALRYDIDNRILRSKFLAAQRTARTPAQSLAHDEQATNELPSDVFDLAVDPNGAITVAGFDASGETNGEAPNSSSEAANEDGVLVTVTDRAGREVTAALSSDVFEDPGRGQSVTDLKAEGKRFYEEKEYDRALESFRRAASLAPKDGEVHYFTGRVYDRTGRHQDARAAYVRSANLGPKDHRPRYYLGEIHFRERRYADAVRYFADAVQLAPNLHQARFNLGVSQAKAGRTNEAIHTYEDLLERDPDRWQAALNLAILLKQKRRSSKALDVLETQSRQHPKVAALHYQRGELYSMKRDHKSAAEAYGRAVQLEPKRYEAHFNLALALSKSGDTAGALQALESASKVKPDDPALHYTIGRLHRDSGEDQAALAAFERALKLNPGHADAAIEAVPLLLKSGQRLDAVSVMRRATTTNTSDYRLHFNAGNLYRKLDEHAEARRAYKNAIRIKSRRAEAYLNLALSYRDTNDYQAAASTYASLLAVQPNHVQANEQLGLLLYRDLNRPRDAKAHLQKYLELYPNAPNAAEIRKLIE